MVGALESTAQSNNYAEAQNILITKGVELVNKLIEIDKETLSLYKKDMQDAEKLQQDALVDPEAAMGIEESKKFGKAARINFKTTQQRIDQQEAFIADLGELANMAGFNLVSQKPGIDKGY